MPVSNTAVAEVSSFSAGGALWMPRRGVSGGSGGPRSRSVPTHVEQAAQHRVADRHRDRRAGRAHRGAAGEAGGRLQRDAAHGRRIDVAVHFQDQRLRPVPLDDQGGVDRRQRAG